jgi:hypothetical protein
MLMARTIGKLTALQIRRAGEGCTHGLVKMRAL